jgi:hypothetical protein
MFVWFVPLILLALAGALFALPRTVTLPIADPADVRLDQIRFPVQDPKNVRLDKIKPGAVREVKGDPPTVVIGTYAMRCNTCHQLFDSTEPTPKVLNQHVDLVFDHGLNSRCFNCHDNEDREKLVRRDGTTFALSDVVTLCAQCHGPTYRDWTKGMHGKTMGSWDASSGKQERLRCDSCHDPHAPAYGPWPLLAGPHTLRAPPPDPSQHEGKPKPSPLQRWLNAELSESHETSDSHDESSSDTPSEKENH